MTSQTLNQSIKPAASFRSFIASTPQAVARSSKYQTYFGTGSAMTFSMLLKGMVVLR